MKEFELRDKCLISGSNRGDMNSIYVLCMQVFFFPKEKQDLDRDIITQGLSGNLDNIHTERYSASL